jgi:glycosyltransferase involved in cell wall biosynthesis
MPVYNSERRVAASIRSLLEQSYTDFELVISDNASSDGTTEILEGFARADPRIVLLRQPFNRGSNANYRAVALAARGRYFKWAASNDLNHPDLVRECVEALSREPQAVLAYPRTRLIEEDSDKGVDYTDNLDLRMDDPIERFDALFARLQLNNVMNGLIQRESLLRTGFLEVPRVLFYRRMTHDASTKAHGQVLEHLYAHRAKGRNFQQWKWCSALTRCLIQGGVRPGDRVRLLPRVAKQWRWSLPMLAEDLRTALGHRPHNAATR